MTEGSLPQWMFFSFRKIIVVVSKTSLWPIHFGSEPCLPTRTRSLACSDGGRPSWAPMQRLWWKLSDLSDEL